MSSIADSAPEPYRATLLSRAWYQSSIEDFVRSLPEAVVGRLSTASRHAVVPEQAVAWMAQIAQLQASLAGLAGAIFLEFDIPRMGRRIDAVLLLGPAIFALEYKVGAETFDRAAISQVWDYALDLKNFHEASHSAPIFPVLIATEAKSSPPLTLEFAEDRVCQPIRAHPPLLREVLDRVTEQLAGERLDETRWSLAPYRPTPTIIEAARALYARHGVEAIARHDAGALNLRVTSARVEQLVEEARRDRRKVICFITGVPGAGKTLVGLNVATLRRDADQTHAVFLSGNGPLVAVLREALTRDDLARRRQAGEQTTKARVANPVKAFIQNVHHFRDEALRDRTAPPADHVVIFDEAQRAWNREKAAQFMKLRKGQPNFDQSEPEFLISYMDRHPDWAVIVCLVGGGQEIHTGEAGIGEWLAAATARFPHWDLYISDQLTDSDYAAGRALDLARSHASARFERDLHLAVSMRSFRAEHVSTFVKALLDCERDGAGAALAKLAGRYPIVVTRDLSRAKQWIRSRARGTERFGIVASSKAMRLKPLAIDIRVSVDPVHWFLDGPEDIRASTYLEDCATEFQVQGLELDWTCVTWDGDLRHAGTRWSCHDFRGSRWERVKSAERQAYLKNAYRVLLTRARQGMVVFVPAGDSADPTRDPGYYDSTFEYLVGLGVPVLSDP
jgi:hypothetical protein